MLLLEPNKYSSSRGTEFGGALVAWQEQIMYTLLLKSYVVLTEQAGL